MAKPWIRFGIGFWIILSPWLLGFAEISFAKWSNVIFGVAIVVMSSWDIFGDAIERARVEKGRAESKNIKK